MNEKKKKTVIGRPCDVGLNSSVGVCEVSNATSSSSSSSGRRRHLLAASSYSVEAETRAVYSIHHERFSFLDLKPTKPPTTEEANNWCFFFKTILPGGERRETEESTSGGRRNTDES